MTRQEQGGTIGVGQAPVPGEQGFSANGQGTNQQAEAVGEQQAVAHFNNYLDALLEQQHRALEQGDNTILMHRAQGAVAVLRSMKSLGTISMAEEKTASFLGQPDEARDRKYNNLLSGLTSQTGGRSFSDIFKAIEDAEVGGDKNAFPVGLIFLLSLVVNPLRLVQRKFCIARLWIIFMMALTKQNNVKI